MHCNQTTPSRMNDIYRISVGSRQKIIITDDKVFETTI